VAETVAGYVEEGDALSRDDALSLFLDAELDLDADALADLAATVELLTGGGEESEGAESEERQVDDGTCDLCERLVKRTFHHLVPKEVGILMLLAPIIVVVQPNPTMAISRTDEQAIASSGFATTCAGKST
jgi:hypothetical protein